MSYSDPYLLFKSKKAKAQYSSIPLSVAMNDIESVNEFVKVEIPQELQDIANKHLTDKKDPRLLHKTMSGGDFIKVMTKDAKQLTLVQEAQRNLFNSWNVCDGNYSKVSALPLNNYSLEDELYIENTQSKKLWKRIPLKNIKMRKTILEEALKNNKDALEKVKNNFLPKSLKGWLTIEDLYETFCKKAQNLILHSKRFKENGIEYIIPCHIDEGIQRLKNLLQKTDFKLINGPAGSGKSTQIVKYIKEHPYHKSAICTLSNTIGLMFKQKCKDIEMFSITKAKFGYDMIIDDDLSITENLHKIRCSKFRKNVLADFDIVVIDEFSQWGIESVNVLNKIIEYNPDAKFFIMGDLNQIPTFLSSGSILFSIMCEFKDNVEEKSELYRFKNDNVRLKMRKILMHEDVSADLKIKKFELSDIDDCDCFITGSNDHVKLLNTLVISQKFCVDSRGMNLSDICKILKDKKIQLIASKTFAIAKGNCIKKICSNERFTLNGMFLSDYVITSNITGETLSISNKTLDFNFNLAYAITVNKSQGLEWENSKVCINNNDKNLMDFNSLYVALSRSSTDIVLLSDDFRDNFTENDLKRCLKIGYDMENLFNIK